MTREDALREIKQYLGVPIYEKSQDEVYLHRNMERICAKNKDATICRWTNLLRNARETEATRKR